MDDGRVTPLPELFTYDLYGTPSAAREWGATPDAYRLSVGGLVENELGLSLGDIQGSFAKVTLRAVLQCTTNVHRGLIEWGGARLADVLESAAPDDRAVKVAFRSADGFDTDLTLDEIRNSDASFLIAYEMNGEPIPPDHGFPVRLASPERYGYKWPKWLREIELVDYDYKGHYEGKRGWSDKGERGKPVC